jgi:predicted permease
MFRRKRSAEDFAAEIKAHLELEADEWKHDGMSEDEARTLAKRAFGNVAAAQERFHLKGRWQWLDTLRRDLRFAVRGLRHSPGFALTAILTLALGVGANTAVFSVMDAVLLRLLPVSDPQRVVSLQTSRMPNRTDTINSNNTFSYAVYDSLRQKKSALSEVIAVAQLSVDKVNVRVGALPEQAEADMVSGNFFSGLGVNLARGRGFTAEDESDHAPVVVLSYQYWTRRFAHDPGVLGNTLFVKGVAFTVVGVSAEGFEGTEPGRSLDFWIPLQNRAEFNVLGNPPRKGQLYQQDPTWWCLELFGRLAPGVSEKQALAQLQSTFATAAYIGLGSPMPAEKLPVLGFEQARNFPGYDGQYGRPLRILMAMVGLVLLIAMTNVVMLLMARNTSRQREFSLRMALGAQRGELLQQLLMESLLLVTVGGVLAWAFAVMATRVLAQWALIEASLAPDRTVLCFAFATLFAAALLFGVAPLRTAIAGGAELALKTSAATAARDAGKTRAGRIIVAVQMALCMVLLVAAGLLLHSLRNLKNIPLGIRTEGLVVFGLNPQSIHTEPELVRFYQELERRLRALPGVEAVTVMSDRLGSGWSSNSYAQIDGRVPVLPQGTSGLVRSNDIGPDFFYTLGVPVLLGREFTDADAVNTQPVAVVNELFVQRFLPGQNPLGHHVDGMTIVGVVKNHKYRGMSEDPIPMAWWDYAQAPNE